MVVVVGSCNVDLTVYAERAPKGGETVLGTRLVIGPGGKGSNQATACARAGCETIFVSKTGRDFFSDILRRHYKSEGISQEYIAASGAEKTGTATIVVEESSGENRIVVVPGANAAMTAEDVRRAEDKIAACGAVLCQLEASLESAAEALRLAKKYGKITVLNPAPACAVQSGYFHGVDFLVPNESEAEFYTGVHIGSAEDAFAAGRALLQLGVKNAVITLGKKGAALVNEQEELIIPATGHKPVDTTGAGDAFCGAFAAALSEGKDAITAIKLANCAASISVTRRGASEAMPRRYEIDALYRKHYA
jgi:ribokinase